MRRLAATLCLAALTAACSEGAGGPHSGTTVIIDPETGNPVEVPVDPETGMPIDPETGMPIDPETGMPIDPETGMPVDPEDPTNPTLPLSDCDTPGPRLIRRLTSIQYENTLKELLGEGFSSETVLSDPAVLGFHVDADEALVADLTAELLMNYTERVTTWAMENQRGRLATCQNHDAACHEQIIRDFGRRAFREDLTDQQVQVYLTLFAGEDTFDEGLHMVVSTMLQSPYLLYRRELGEPDPAVQGEFVLTPFEVASELSYLLTDSPPDDQLLAQAAEGRLSTAEEINQVVDRLAFSEKGRQSLSHFVQGWLDIDNLDTKAKDPNVFDLTDSLRADMLGETSQFFLQVIQSGGTIGDLFGADFTMLNSNLANFYGLSASSGDAFSQVSLDGKRPSGVLGHASFLTMHALQDNSSPVQRGVTVRERLLCQDLPPVPSNLDTSLDDLGEYKTNRQRYEQHSASDGCYTCHRAIDPIGFAFEKYDAFGRYRESENGVPVDASGELDAVLGGPVSLDGVQSLSDFLSQSDEARSCFVRYWSYYAYGRDEWTDKACNHDSIRREAREAGYSLKDTLSAIVHAPHFTRRVKDAE